MKKHFQAFHHEICAADNRRGSRPIKYLTRLINIHDMTMGEPYDVFEEHTKYINFNIC